MNLGASYRSLVAATLVAGGIFHFVAPVLAEGTTAGTTISNTATATYEDPNAPGTTINATSNTVTISVAEVSGITVTSSGTTLSTTVGDPNRIDVGDTVNYAYTITNVGNDPTKFRIPNAASVTGPATAGTLQYSIDGGQTWTNFPGSEYITNSIPAGGSVMVRVPVTITTGATAGQVVAVKLGQTPGDDQNIPRTTADGGDVYTVDNPDPATSPDPITREVAGAPINGVREASATQQATVAAIISNQALATVFLTNTGRSDAGTPTVLTDDILTYSLGLRVESTDPTGTGVTPAPLSGAPISLDGATATRILISDAIPAGTQLVARPLTPPGWRVVYSTTPIGTNANSATWLTWNDAAPPALGSVTRIGFVNDPAVLTSVAPGTTVTGFSAQVRTIGANASPFVVGNIAQLFGQTAGTTTLVYDESGDQQPSNYDPSTGFVNVPTDGYINDANDLTATGSDTANNNTGTGAGGEANVFTLTAPIAASVLAGPNGQPAAVGPTSINDDFTNKSALVPAGTAPGATIDPASVSFTNTILNNGTDVNNISLVPTPPAVATNLPTNTVVVITYGSESKSYIWTGTTFVFDGDGNPATTADQSPIDAPGEYITILGVQPNTPISYGVEVNLPPGTPLSTDINRGFPVPVTAFIDGATPGLQATDPQNITIGQVYTGFLKMLKESRVLQGTGPAVQGTQGTFSIAAKNPAPGNIIEYRISYTNISTPQAGSGNVILNASRVVITEDGVAGTNNWARDNDGNNIIDTSNIVGSAIDSSGGSVTFTPAGDQSGTTATTDVTKYVNTVNTPVAPGVTRTFTFQRKVN